MVTVVLFVANSRLDGRSGERAKSKGSGGLGASVRSGRCAYRMVLPVRRRIHWGIGRFCFWALASFCLVRNDLWLCKVGRRLVSLWFLANISALPALSPARWDLLLSGHVSTPTHRARRLAWTGIFLLCFGRRRVRDAVRFTPRGGKGLDGNYIPAF